MVTLVMCAKCHVHNTGITHIYIQGVECYFYFDILVVGDGQYYIV